MRVSILIAGCFAIATTLAAETVRGNASTNTAAASLVIPLVDGRIAGKDSVHTDISVTNHRNVQESVSLDYYIAGEFYYGPAFSTGLTLQPLSTLTIADVTNTLLVPFAGTSGTIIINDKYYRGSPAARIDATYRIWSGEPGKTGTMSRASAALDEEAIPASKETQVIIGVRDDQNHRCRVGIFSNSYYNRTFQITVRSSSGSETMTSFALGLSLTEVTLPPSALGYVTITIVPLDDPSGDFWTAYASSVDLRSGDSWLQNSTRER